VSMVLARLRGFYGANPLHLLALLGCFALAGWAALHTLSTPAWPVILVWFVGAVIAHDLVLFPLYALADRSLTSGLRARRPGHHRTGSATPSPIPSLNHLRVPLLGAALLLLVFFPGILGQGGQTYLDATGQKPESFLARWLLLTAAMFLVSAVIYGARLARAPRHPEPTPPATGVGSPTDRSANGADHTSSTATPSIATPSLPIPPTAAPRSTTRATTPPPPPERDR